MELSRLQAFVTVKILFLESGNKMQPLFPEISNAGFIIRMFQINRGNSYLPRYAFREDVAEGKLTLLDIEEFLLTMYPRVIYHKQNQRKDSIWISS